MTLNPDTLIEFIAVSQHGDRTLRIRGFVPEEERADDSDEQDAQCESDLLVRMHDSSPARKQPHRVATPADEVTVPDP